MWGCIAVFLNPIDSFVHRLDTEAKDVGLVGLEVLVELGVVLLEVLDGLAVGSEGGITGTKA